MNSHDHGQHYGTCRDMLSDLNDYIDGELDDTLCLEIETHMSECENCRVVVDTLRKTVLLYHALEPEPIPEEVERRLFKSLELADFVGAE
jgi:anti-sigma factor RsiW